MCFGTRRASSVYLYYGRLFCLLHQSNKFFLTSSILNNANPYYLQHLLTVVQIYRGIASLLHQSNKCYFDLHLSIYKCNRLRAKKCPAIPLLTGLFALLCVDGTA